MTKRRNFRQRKKLHLGEFKELGFKLGLVVHEGLGDKEVDALIDDFIGQVIEPRGLIYGGVLSYGFVCRDRRGDVTEDDRLAVRDWLSRRKEAVSFELGELVDAWK